MIAEKMMIDSMVGIMAGAVAGQRYETVDKHAGHFAQEVEQQDEKQTFYHDEQ